MEISKNKIKYINSLSQKKNRDINNVFIAEGSKLTLDLIPYLKVKYLFCTKEWYEDNLSIVSKYEIEELIIVPSLNELKKISQMTNPSPVLCVFYKKREISEDIINLHEDLVLVLDSIQDPGNLGTIIRSADWFGVKYIYCSLETVDIYNPKVINSTMGAIARVDVLYGDISKFIKNSIEKGRVIYGTFLEGDNIYNCKLENSGGVIVMGNEGKGISDEICNLVSQKLFIPNYPLDAEGLDSLNVAVATSIILSEFRRR